MTIKIVKTIDLTDYENSHHREGEDGPEIGVHLLQSEIEHVDGQWEAFIDLGGLRDAAERGDTPEIAMRKLISRLKGEAGYLMKKANDLLSVKIPKHDVVVDKKPRETPLSQLDFDDLVEKFENGLQDKNEDDRLLLASKEIFRRVVVMSSETRRHDCNGLATALDASLREDLTDDSALRAELLEIAALMVGCEPLSPKSFVTVLTTHYDDSYPMVVDGVANALALAIRTEPSLVQEIAGDEQLQRMVVRAFGILSRKQ